MIAVLMATAAIPAINIQIKIVPHIGLANGAATVFTTSMSFIAASCSGECATRFCNIEIVGINMNDTAYINSNMPRL